VSDFFVIDQDMVTTNRPITLGELPEDLDPLDLIQGHRLQPREKPIALRLRETSGDFCPDMITYLIPLFSDKLRQALDALGIDNIDYYAVRLTHPRNVEIDTTYWLANVVGSVECLDVENSNVTRKEGRKTYKIKSFVIDESRVGDARLFRLAEKKTIILIDQTLKDELEKLDLKDVRILNTREYDGF